MRNHPIFLLICICGLSSCADKSIPMELNHCISAEFDHELNYNDLVIGMPQNVLSALVERPNDNGALGRNKAGYIHARFQITMTRLTDYAIRLQDNEGLSEYLKNLNYSFSHQNSEGDFIFNAPDYLLEDATYQAPSDADLASGTAFFAYSLGLSLNSLQQSNWYGNSTSLVDLRYDIKAFDPNIKNMLNYLKRHVDLLYTVDTDSPNRLLFNGIAFYSLGIYLEDQEAKNIGIEFANNALLLHHEKEGYFIEGGGWDSSYNGVAIKLGLEFFTLIPINSEQETKNELEKVLSCAIDWQKSRILSSGEISTQGNTRVFHGGEKFLGKEKEVDVIKTVKAFFYMNTVSNTKEYEVLAQRIIEFYK